MSPLRQRLLDSALQVVRDEGYRGLTQPKVARQAGVRQSHLTYHYPSRQALLEAVAERAVQMRLEALAHALSEATLETFATAVAPLVVRHDTTRVLMALAQAAEEQPAVRQAFHTMAEGTLVQVRAFFHRYACPLTEDEAVLLQSLTMGLAVMELAQVRSDALEWSTRALQAAVALLAARGGSPSLLASIGPPACHG